jgi:hypothetical protein
MARSASAVALASTSNFQRPTSNSQNSFAAKEAVPSVRQLVCGFRSMGTDVTDPQVQQSSVVDIRVSKEANTSALSGARSD